MIPEEYQTEPLERIFSNPICQKTFVSLPRIYGLKDYVYKRRVKKNNTSVKVSKEYSSRDREERGSKSIKSQSSLGSLGKRDKGSYMNLKSLSNTKEKQMVILNKMSSLTDLEKDHKIGNKKGIVLSPITQSLQQLPALRNFYFPEKLPKFQKNKNEKFISPIHQTIEQYRVVTPDSTSNLRRNQTNYSSHPSKLQSKTSKQIGVQISFFNSSQFSSRMKQNTYFRNFINRSSEESAQNTPTCRSLKSDSSSSFSIPTQDDILQFIKNYKPLDQSFNINKLTKSIVFKIVPYKNGIYLGEFVNKQRHGLGVFITDKYIFEGNFEKGFKRSGCQLNSEGMYTGEFVNGIRQGKGSFKWNKGESYDGMWKAGMKNGYGTWKSSAGDSYEGQWKANKQQGYGIHHHLNSVYEGQFVNFLKHGKGKQQFTNGDVYEGQYVLGKPNKWGVYSWKNGDKYQGQFQNGFRHGYGTLIQNGSCYKGHFIKDVKDGIGQIHFPDGTFYKGQFKNDQFVD